MKRGFGGVCVCFGGVISVKRSALCWFLTGRQKHALGV